MDLTTAGNTLAHAMSTGLTVFGAIQQLVDGRRVKALQDFKVEAEARLSQLEQATTDEEVAKTLEKIEWAIARDATEEKTKIFAAILAGRYSGTLSDAIAETLTSVVDELTPSHMHVLRAVRQLPPDHQLKKDERPCMITFGSLLEHIASDTNQLEKSEVGDLLLAWTAKLTTAGLLKSSYSDTRGLVLTGVSFSGLIKSQAFQLSKLGVRLVSMLDQ